MIQSYRRATATRWNFVVLEKSQLLEILKAGDAESLEGVNSSDLMNDALVDDEVSLMLHRAAERVVFHRPNYYETIKRCVELGVPCEIWTAARAGLIEHVKRLLRQNSELLNRVDSGGRTSLQRAALIYGVCHHCEEVVSFLISAGADVDIFTACTFCMPERVHQELQRMPDLVGARCQGSTPLNWAVRPRKNHAESPGICQTLVGAGADVNDQDEHEFGMTPLHHAAEWGPPVCLDLVDLLLRAGADINCTDNQGWTPLDYALDRHRTKVATHLISLGAVGKNRGNG